MKYKLLGKSGLRVSELCLGTMTFGEEWGYGVDKAGSKLILESFAKNGGNFLDTANRYTEGTSEKYLGEFLKGDRDHFVLATKYSLYERKADVNGSGNHRKNLIQSVEASLKRLQTDYIDILWLHAWDFTTPIEEVMRALDDLVRMGKVLYLGISDTPAWIVSKANTLAELRAWTQFVALQVEYSLLQRTAERDLIPMAHHFQMSITPWGPLAGGALTGKYLTETKAKKGDQKRLKTESKRLDARSQDITKKVVEIAKEIGASATHVALNWIRSKSPDFIPIIGARTAAQIEESMKCLNFSLNETQIKQLDEVSQFELGFPHEFLASEGVRQIAFGGTYDQIEVRDRQI